MNKLTNAWDVLRILRFDQAIPMFGSSLRMVIGKHLTKKDALALQTESLEQRHDSKVLIMRHRASSYCGECVTRGLAEPPVPRTPQIEDIVGHKVARRVLPKR